MGGCARFLAFALTLGPAVAVGVVVGPPAEPADSPAAWFKQVEYPGSGAWEWLLKLNDDSAVWLYTHQNAVHSGAQVSAWRRIEFRDPQSAAAVSKLWTGAYRSLVERVDVNCDNPAERRRAANGFRGLNMTDPIEPALVFDEAQSQWQPAVPGSEVAVFVNQVCALFRPRGMKPY